MTGPDDGGHVPAAGPDADAVARWRAARLLRWYPGSWRARYGEEFTELLVSDIAERPFSPSRTLDVARGGIMAWLSGAGLAGFALALPGGSAHDLAAARARQVAASLATMSAASGVFLIVGAAWWSQFLIFWVWAERRRVPWIDWPPASAGYVVLGSSAAILAFFALGLLAALPVLATVAARIKSPTAVGQRQRLATAAATLAAALAALFIGGRALENNWIGTGGLHSPVPGGLAAFIWAVTLFVNAYWAHPQMLDAFPAGEVHWMLLSPLLLAIAVASLVVMIRCAGLSPRVARFEARLGIVTCAVMTAFAALLAALFLHTGPEALLHLGRFNNATGAVLVLALITGVKTTRMATRNLRSPHPRTSDDSITSADPAA